MNKKGQLQIVSEMAEGFKVMFAFILVAIIVSVILINFAALGASNPAFQSSTLSGVLTKMQEYPVFVDWGALLLYGMLFVISIYTMSQIESQPILYVVAWIGLIVLSLTLIATGYALDTIVNSTMFADAVAYMIFIPFYSANAFLFSVIYFFANIIALHTPKA